MSRRSWLAAICLVGALCVPAHAGERVMAEFFDASEGRNQRTPEVLPHVPLKAIVAEFLDPLDVGLGKSLSYLVWRETLTAISDQAGAGVILAEAPPGERLVDMLERDYHLAAERIARHQHGRMALWGAVEPEGDALIIEPYLSIQDVKGDSALRLALEGKVVTGPRRSAQAERQPLISAAIRRNRFNFAPVSRTRSELFERPIVITSRVAVRGAPQADAAVLEQVPAGRVLHAVDMQGAWFEVELPGGRHGFVHAGTFGNLQLPPRQVIADLGQVNLRGGPGTDHPVVAKRDLKGAFRVLDMRYREGKGLWYRIDTGAGETWVAGWLVRPRFSLPVVHFLAGLYRYYGNRPQDGITAFEDFIRAAGDAEDHIVLATGYQLLGACRLLSDPKARRGYDDFTQALRHTPYDPDAYLLRSVAALGNRQAGKALDDLDRALQLDASYPPARELAATLAAVAGQGGVTPLAVATGLMNATRATTRLVEKYGIQVDTPSRPGGRRYR